MRIIILVIGWFTGPVCPGDTGSVNLRTANLSHSLGGWVKRRRDLLHLPQLTPPLSGVPWIATRVMLETSLSYLGLGQPPTPSWGLIRDLILLSFFPGCHFSRFGDYDHRLSFNLLGDGLRDALDPSQRGRLL
jgi:peptide/nickel transport system permease protein